ncbi:hypothetical protein CERSUDRAFT_116557 [Gelatoporia subvermispora B]|uniref:Amidohydrolase-related domain-containing protein n=1 Tax=Ceriporiopsis subvermispora (strain B) TaxID=914234 RepID=M2PGD3_CERS8|nr:hypothetical protein CERSUDRAFT_116557 [Gelatoporia subvermispora B]
MALTRELAELHRIVFSYPAIDNHAHALLKPEFRDVFPFEGLISEATGCALTQDAVQTLACFRATAQLAGLFRLDPKAGWEDVKRTRQAMNYDELCRICMGPTRIQCILIDDGLGTAGMCEDYKWHDRFTASPTKRIVRVEIVAEGILKELMDAQLLSHGFDPLSFFGTFRAKLTSSLTASALDPEVAGFKSIACYRTGLDISVQQDTVVLEQEFIKMLLQYESARQLRLEHKSINDFVVNTTLRIAGQHGKPVQFHTGLGDNDISLARATPALMQPLIKAYPNTKIVLLHSAYPYTQQAGYLAAVYMNVYLDFGEIFPFLSADGQRDVVKQVLELCPITKIMWSTDGHYWPESYYLGTIQAREVLFQVLEVSMRREELTLAQATAIVTKAFFENANRIYNLGLTPVMV